MGRLCLLNQFDSNACDNVDGDWKIFTSSLHCLLHCENTFCNNYVV